MIKRIAAGALVLLLSLFSVGCAHRQDNQYGKYFTDLVSAGYFLADRLENNLDWSISPDEPLLVASFVNINNLEESSALGRILAEHVGSRLVQKGFSLVEIKLRQTSLFVQEGKGEFLLSRDLQEISKNHQAAYVIVGTYAAGYNRLYVSSRIVRTADNVVMASSDCGIFLEPFRLEALVKEK